MEFWATMLFGSSKQKLTINLDTGSSVLWFYSEEGCKKSGECFHNADFFREKKSKTLQVSEWDYVWLRYGIGAWGGKIAWDQFCLSKNYCLPDKW